MDALQIIRALPRRWRRRTVSSVLVLVLGSLTVFVAAAAADTAPTNTSLPTITGTAQQGHTLTVQSGSWSGTNPIVLSYQWRRCDTNGAGCADIAGAIGQTYTLAAADIGATLRISVTATNSQGTAKVLSDPERGRRGAQRAAEHCGAVDLRHRAAGRDPNGEQRQLERLTADQLRLQAGSSATRTAPAAATSAVRSRQTYAPTGSDVGHTIRVEVTATNAAGSSSAVSGSSSMIVGPGQCPREHGQADALRDAQRGLEAHGQPGRLAGRDAALLLLRLAALRRQRQQLQRHLRCGRPAVHARPR